MDCHCFDKLFITRSLVPNPVSSSQIGIFFPIEDRKFCDGHAPGNTTRCPLLTAQGGAGDPYRVLTAPLLSPAATENSTEFFLGSGGWLAAYSSSGWPTSVPSEGTSGSSSAPSGSASTGGAGGGSIDSASSAAPFASAAGESSSGENSKSSTTHQMARFFLGPKGGTCQTSGGLQVQSEDECEAAHNELKLPVSEHRTGLFPALQCGCIRQTRTNKRQSSIFYWNEEKEKCGWQGDVAPICVRKNSTATVVV